MHRPFYWRIYRSWWHVVATLVLIAAPFVALAYLAHLTHMEIGRIFTDLTASFWRIALAYVISAILGWLLAVLLARGRVSTVALPVFDVLQSIPTFAALPLAVAVWGPNNLTIVIFLILAIIWPLFFTIVSSMRLLRRDWEEAVHMARLTRWQRFTHFLVPVTLPGVVTGSIIGLGDGWEALIATEIIVRIRPGMGSFFSSVAHNAQLTILGIFGFLLFIFAINKLVWLPLLERSHRMLED